MQIEELLNKLNKKKKNWKPIRTSRLTYYFDWQANSKLLIVENIYIKKKKLIKHFLFGCFKMDEEKNYSSIHASVTAIATQVDW